MHPGTNTSHPCGNDAKGGGGGLFVTSFYKPYYIYYIIYIILLRLLTFVTLVKFILVARRVIRSKCLTTSMASSLLCTIPGNWTNCSYNRKSEGCPVSNLKKLDEL